jgi:hypothetical protein
MIALADLDSMRAIRFAPVPELASSPMVSKPNTSPAQERGFWSKAMYVHEPETDTYRCPAGA